MDITCYEKYAILKALFHSSQKPTRNLAARTFILSKNAVATCRTSVMASIRRDKTYIGLFNESESLKDFGITINQF